MTFVRKTGGGRHTTTAQHTTMREHLMCQHQPPCPQHDAGDGEAARIVSAQPEQGWSLLCNGIVVFDDTGELLPDGSVVAPHRGPALHATHAGAAA